MSTSYFLRLGSSGLLRQRLLDSVGIGGFIGLLLGSDSKSIWPCHPCSCGLFLFLKKVQIRAFVVCGRSKKERSGGLALPSARRNTMIGAVVLLIMVWGSLINYVDLHRHLVSPRERRLTLTLCLTKQ